MVCNKKELKKEPTRSLLLFVSLRLSLRKLSEWINENENAKTETTRVGNIYSLYIYSLSNNSFIIIGGRYQFIVIAPLCAKEIIRTPKIYNFIVTMDNQGQ